MKKIIPILAAVALIFSGCGLKNEQNSINQEVKTQEKKPIYIMAGKIDTNEKADIVSKITARISAIKVDVGVSVKEGDVLVKLDTRDLEAQVNQAQAAVNTANSNLIKTKTGARPEQIAQAQAVFDSAKVSVDTAKNNYDRNNELFKAGGISASQLETYRTQFVAAQAQYDSSKEQLDILKKGETPETLNILKDQLAQAQAALKLAQTQLANGTITSPVSGIVSARNVNVGELAMTGSALITIVNADALYVNAYLPASMTGKVKEGQKVKIKVPDASDKEYKGEILTIDPAVDSKGKNVLLKIKFDESDSILKPGMFAEIGI